MDRTQIFIPALDDSPIPRKYIVHRSIPTMPKRVAFPRLASKSVAPAIEPVLLQLSA